MLYVLYRRWGCEDSNHDFVMGTDTPFSTRLSLILNINFLLQETKKLHSYIFEMNSEWHDLSYFCLALWKDKCDTWVWEVTSTFPWRWSEKLEVGISALTFMCRALSDTLFTMFTTSILKYPSQVIIITCIALAVMLKSSCAHHFFSAQSVDCKIKYYVYALAF